MKIAIVGTSRDLTPREYFNMKDKIKTLLRSYLKSETTIISGGAKGVDILAENIARNKGFKTQIYETSMSNWEGYKVRNMQIAEDCDELYCLTLHTKERMCYHHTPHADHEKTAGCWTMNHALRLNKPCKLIVINK